MPLEATNHHARFDIAAQAQLQAQSPPRNLSLGLFVLPDDMAQAVRPPREQHIELLAGAAGFCLGKVHRDSERCLPRGPKRRREDGHLASGPGRRVAAQIEAHDAVQTAGESESHGCGCGGEIMPSVNGEYEAGVQIGMSRLKSLDGGQQDGDVLLGGEVRGSARRGAQFEIHDAVSEEVLENRRRRVPYRLLVREEVVYVAAEQGEEPVRANGGWLVSLGQAPRVNPISE
jgi:hypothetical protein